MNSRSGSNSMFPYGLLSRLLVLPFLIVCALHAHGADLPPGFAERQIASGLTGATAMAFAPDGRLFVCQQGGQLRVVKNSTLLSLYRLDVASFGRMPRLEEF